MTRRNVVRNRLRSGAGNLFFIGVLMGSACLSLLRVLAVAASLPKLDFGTYATVTATGAFLGALISFGAVEGTVKRFPRLAASGNIALIREQSVRIRRLLLLRTICIGVPIVSVGIILSQHVMLIAGVAFAFAFSTSYTGLVSSLQRAFGNTRLILGGTVFRAALSFLVVVTVARIGDMTAVLIAEFLAAIAGCLLYDRLFLFRGTRVQTENSGDRAKSLVGSAVRESGIPIFVTYLLVSVPFYLDRIYVTAVIGRDAAADYAILALLLTVAMLLVNSVASKAGPQAIKIALADNGRKNAIMYVVRWIIAISSIWLFVIGFVYIVIYLNLVPGGLGKYQINLDYLFPIAVLGVLFSTALIEFLSMAFDSDMTMVSAAICYVAAIVVAALFVALFGHTLLTFLWLLVAARAIYMVLLLLGLHSSGSAGIGPRDG